MPAPTTRWPAGWASRSGTADALVLTASGCWCGRSSRPPCRCWCTGAACTPGTAGGRRDARPRPTRPRAAAARPHRGRFDPRAVSLAAALTFGLLLASTEWPLLPRSRFSGGCLGRLAARQLGASHRPRLLRGARRRRAAVRAGRRARPGHHAQARAARHPARAGGHLAARGGRRRGPARGGQAHAREGCGGCRRCPRPPQVLDSLGSERRLAAAAARWRPRCATCRTSRCRSSTRCSDGW